LDVLINNLPGQQLIYTKVSNLKVAKLKCKSCKDINTGVLKMQAQRKDANAVEKHRIS